MVSNRHLLQCGLITKWQIITCHLPVPQQESVCSHLGALDVSHRGVQDMENSLFLGIPWLGQRFSAVDLGSESLISARRLRKCLIRDVTGTVS